MDDEADARPTVVTVMAEYQVRDPVWDRSPGRAGDVDLAALGVSPGLVSALREWNARFERLLGTDFRWESPEARAAWVRDGLHLAHDLQSELPDVEVRYADDGDPRPVRERRGP